MRVYVYACTYTLRVQAPHAPPPLQTARPPRPSPSSDSKPSTPTPGPRRQSANPLPSPHQPSTERVFQAMDLDGDGRINFKEFCATVRANRRLSIVLERLKPHERPLWNVQDNRPAPQTSARCHLCARPFAAGPLRRGPHTPRHCRACGAAVCAGCSKHCLPLPLLGYYRPVRVCDACAQHEPQKPWPVPAPEPGAGAGAVALAPPKRRGSLWKKIRPWVPFAKA